MSPDLLQWATILFKERGGTYETLSAELLKTGYTRKDIDAVYDEMVRLGHALPPPPAPEKHMPTSAQSTPSAPHAPTSPEEVQAHVDEARVVDEEVHTRISKPVAFLILGIIRALVASSFGTYWYAKNNPQGSLAAAINKIAVTLYLNPPFSQTPAP